MQALGWEKGEDGIYVRNGERFHFTIQTRDYEEERIDIAIHVRHAEAGGVEMEVVLVAKFDWNAWDTMVFWAGFATQFDRIWPTGSLITTAVTTPCIIPTRRLTGC